MKMGFITFCLFFLATSHYVLCYKREKIDIIEYKIIEEENCTFGSDCPHGPCINGKCRQGESCQPSTHHQIDTGECCSDQDCNESFYYSSMPKICYVNMTGYSYCLFKGQFLTFLRTKDLTARLATIDGICETSEQCPAKSICKDLDYIKRCECLPAFPRFNKMYNICQRQTQPPQSDDSVRALEIYKITMIFASCLLAMVLVAFLYCIIKKSFCGTRSLHSSGPPDIMTLFAESAAESGSPFGVQPPFEKPPSYDESQNHMREVFGVPPPSYPGPSTSQSEPGSSPINRPSPSNIERVRAVLGRGLVSSDDQSITVEAEVSPSTQGVQNRGFSE